VITPVGELVTENERIRLTAAGTHQNSNEIATRLRTKLLDLQYGRSEDKYGWLTKLV
jgi:branched-chain amino acid aminotransferase